MFEEVCVCLSKGQAQSLCAVVEAELRERLDPIYVEAVTKYRQGRMVVTDETKGESGDAILGLVRSDLVGVYRDLAKEVAAAPVADAGDATVSEAGS